MTDTPEVRAAIETLRNAGWRLTKRRVRGRLSDLMPDLLAMHSGPGTVDHIKLVLQTPWEPVDPEASESP